MIKTLADTIIWVAQERMKTEKFQNINSAVHAIEIEITQHLMEFMNKNKPKKEKKP